MQNMGIFVINIAKSDDLWRDVTAAIVHYPNFDTTSPLSKEVPLYLLFLFLCIGRDEERKWKSNVRKICLKRWQHIVVVEVQHNRKARDGPQSDLRVESTSNGFEDAQRLGFVSGAVERIVRKGVQAARSHGGIESKHCFPECSHPKISGMFVTHTNRGLLSGGAAADRPKRRSESPTRQLRFSSPRKST
jgi:hypothetical protein